ncbi:hypothetical protein C8Q77DRAFT_590376 [Trametes polyzona]|nr:hypothetical protein C8Q77DRAFT_590376 [Trametes polyzona]
MHNIRHCHHAMARQADDAPIAALSGATTIVSSALTDNTLAFNTNPPAVSVTPALRQTVTVTVGSPSSSWAPNTANGTETTTPPPRSRLSSGLVAGLVVTISVLTVAIALASRVYLRERRRTQAHQGALLRSPSSFMISHSHRCFFSWACFVTGTGAGTGLVLTVYCRRRRVHGTVRGNRSVSAAMRGVSGGDRAPPPHRVPTSLNPPRAGAGDERKSTRGGLATDSFCASSLTVAESERPPMAALPAPRRVPRLETDGGVRLAGGPGPVDESESGEEAGDVERDNGSGSVEARTAGTCETAGTLPPPYARYS